MKDLASAYSARKYAKGGKARMMCAHGGPVKCSEGCYAKMDNPKLEAAEHMSEGGEVMDEMEHIEKTGDLDNEMESMSEDAPMMDDPMQDEVKSGAGGGRLLSKLLDNISKAHYGSKKSF